MRIGTFESFDDSKKREERPRPERKEKVKRCIGQCQRKLFIKDGKPVIYCPSCQRVINK